MRLINATSYKLQSFDDDTQLPRYAILSHTWADSEVTIERFKDIHSADRSRRERVKKMLGYRKIVKACQQAVLDGLTWLWIDTCCIDKSSSAELSEAINSMYRYYKQAKICYAYLPDVVVEATPVRFDGQEVGDSAIQNGTANSGDQPSSPPAQDTSTATYVTEQEFCKAKWFTRGWTLQELIAPKEVVFYAKGWKYIGKRSYMRPMLERITGISESALQGKGIENDSVARRMSWMSKRSTTRVEDLAYSLLGICGVNMPLLYGEGEKAFMRLQEEIMKNSDDQSLFAWTPSDDSDSTIPRPRTAFALHPREFADANMIGYSPFFPGQGQPYALTNKGISVNLCLSPLDIVSPSGEKMYAAILECHYSDRALLNFRPAIVIQRLSKQATQYCRLTNMGLVAIDVDQFHKAEWKDVYLCKTIPRWWYVEQEKKLASLGTTQDW